MIKEIKVNPIRSNKGLSYAVRDKKDQIKY